jgi:hypothetical protein
MMIKVLVLIFGVGFAMLVVAGEMAAAELAWAGLALYFLGALGAVTLKIHSR